MAHTEVPRETAEFDIDDARDCRYWSNTLGVSAEEFKAAVCAVGPRIEDVKRHLDDRSAAGIGSRG